MIMSWNYINETISGWCLSPFWDANLTWNSSDPDFTICFEKTVLVWLPSLYLLLFTPLEIYFHRSSNSSCIPPNRYNSFKLVIIVLVGTLALADTLMNYMYLYLDEENPPPVDFYTSLIKFFTFYLFFELTYFSIRSGIRSSGILFIFSFLTLVCGAPQMRTELKSGVLSDLNKAGLREIVDFTSYSLYYLLALIIFVLNCYADSYPISQFIHENKCPETDSSFLSKFLFSWFNDLAWKGYRKQLSNEDLWEVDNDLRTANVARKFESKWRHANDRLRKNRTERVVRDAENEVLVENEFGQENTNSEDEKEVSILLPLCQTFGAHYLQGALFRLVFSSLLCVSPEILNLIIAFIDDEKEFLWRGYLYSVMLLVVAVTRTLLLNQYFNTVYRVGLKIRAALISVIYKKSLKISNGAKNSYSAGEINNLMAVDASRFVETLVYISMLWAAPMEVGITIYLLYNILGVSVFAGVAGMAVLVPLNAYLAAQLQKLQKKRMEFKDERVKYMTEVLHGIKVLKLYAWEPRFEDHISKIRDKEIRTMKVISYIEAISRFLWSLAPTLFSIISFAVYVLSSDEHVLDVQTAFVSLALFNSIRMPLSQLPPTLADVIQTWVSMKRISKFLNAEELDPNATSHEPRHEPIIIENGQFSWEGRDGLSVLYNINVNIQKGHLVAVVGAVGAGKSSLLSALLGEVYKQSGFVNTTGTSAYVPQQAWIRNETFKANITLGDTRKSRQFYESVLNACALVADLKILPGGDQTEIGEKGVNLSGGQKQRISLARAVYSEADIYLLDDPLSAVDSHVGKHIFEQVIGPSGLLKNKTRILVTHHITYLPQVDFIIVLKDGTISESGTYENLVEKKGDFANFLADFMTEEKANFEDKTESTDVGEFRNGEDFGIRQNSISSLSDDSSVISESVVVGVGGQKLIVEEEIETGSVKFVVYKYFVKAIGLCWTLTIVLSSVVFIALTVMNGLWLSIWSSDGAANNKQYFYLGVYALLGLSLAFSAFVQVASVYFAILKGAKSLHNYLLTAVLRWPVLTFDKIPIGRIINRFSADIEVLDSTLTSNLQQLLWLTVLVVSTLFVISYSTPKFLIILVLLGIVYSVVQRFFVATARQLRRLESVSKSPIFSHFEETLEGSPSVRAYCLQTRFIRDSENKVDKSLKCSYLGFVANRWLSVRLETLGSLITFSSAVFAVTARSTLSAGLAALSITYSIQITNTLYVWLRMMAELETNVVAIERLKKYIDMEQEEPWDLPDDENVPYNWPNGGEIVFSDLRARYQECLKPVLKGISFIVNRGEKVGIVGRTGAGKSSLTLCLFRIIESCGGKITIDGIDITKLGLHTLRSRLTIIPQDPTLFTGTLRMNLDPTETLPDESLWNALEMTDLKKYLMNLNYGLDYRVTEGGSNFSVGQRQLICLARALLRKTKVLILDEATAAIDMETDALIQTTIRKEFEGSTVLTIAHRLNTVLDYDRILVLDNGSIVEYDCPKKLLHDEESVFCKMAADAGLTGS